MGLDANKKARFWVLHPRRTRIPRRPTNKGH